MTRNGLWGLTLMCMPVLVGGCIGAPARPGAKKATDIDPKLAESTYWLAKPVIASVTSRDFGDLWRACEKAARSGGFTLDRLDYRAGVITTQPLISKQFFEVWRNDIVGFSDLANSSLATMRRTVRFEITRLANDEYRCDVKVVVERYSVIEHRVSNVTRFGEVFALTREEASRERDRIRDPASAGTPTAYWYAVGRDPDLERRIAGWIRDGLKPDDRIVASRE